MHQALGYVLEMCWRKKTPLSVLRENRARPAGSDLENGAQGAKGL